MNNSLDINSILDKLRLSQNMSGADFGTGPGNWAMELARRLRKGLVYAIDIQEGYLSATAGKAKYNYLDNIRFLQRDLTEIEGSGLPDSSLDLVIIANMLFQIEDKKPVIMEASRVLKRRGKLLIIDWRPESPVIRNQKPVSLDEIEDWAERYNLHLAEELDLGEYHFGLILKKS